MEVKGKWRGKGEGEREVERRGRGPEKRVFAAFYEEGGIGMGRREREDWGGSG